VWNTAWNGRRVMGTSDCLWGLLDGMNEDGLAVSLTFGGRPVLGDGFGVPLVLRYLLETCSTVAEAAAVLARLPYHLAHSLTLADVSGEVLTAHLSPDRGVAFRHIPAATNHQDVVEWTEHAAVTRTLEREARILAMLDDPSTTAEGFVQAFLAPPLRSTTYSRGFGTLYTAAYNLPERSVDYVWLGASWSHSLHAFHPGTHVEALVEASVA
jgi:predicted choloylglycine hydrolase